MYFKNEAYSHLTTTKPSLNDLKNQFSRFTLDCGFFRANAKRQIEGLQNNYDALILYYGKIIEETNKQIATDAGILKEVEAYGEDGDALQSRIKNELGRLNSYLQEIQSQLAKTTSLKRLCSLNPGELFEEAIKNKSSALLIAQTPELSAKITSSQCTQITHKDAEIVKLLALILMKREYSFATPTIFAELKLQAQTEGDKFFIAEKENEAVSYLLLKIKHYLDKKIAQALQEKTTPWALGYFGSRHKLTIGEKKISVPQGIYELKRLLDHPGNHLPVEILSKMQNMLHEKNIENKDESLFTQFKRLISLLFGYRQSQETSKEYEYLEQVTLGGRAIP
ncbi:hypothetical protein OQJ15_08440 [Fluoribacter dumoffii]|uniref:hypothetical protein n=1 Tax=Fluoribacter dumoffii TaxID=463 RepID=UPI002243C9E3|nr:hypothetical protein [Fluoribacter dumoffii]MCW8386331.1 hypothetical protein [Fluoribacter dumoffii]MCW8498395.1 hypothetical protein [Fluoribacter dumoffii]